MTRMHYLPFLALGLSFSVQGADSRDLHAPVVGSSPSQPDGRVWAVVVGISDFKNLSGKDDLAYGEKDARYFAEQLKALSGGRIPAENVSLLVESAATRDSVWGALDRTLAKAGIKDTVVLYFATHGVIMGSEGYLLMWDSERDERLPQSSLSLRMLDVRVGQGLGNVVMISDACHSAISGASGVRSGPANPVNDLIHKIGHQRAQVFNLASSLVNQQSLEGEAYCGGHGAFTCTLVKAMKGEADEDGDGAVNLGELASRMPMLVRAATGFKQTPEAKGIYDQNLVISRAERRATVASSVERPAPGKVEVRPNVATELEGDSEAAYELRVGGVEYTMAPIPAGSFMMGSPASEEGRDSDETQHQVRLSRSYWIGETEVTQGLWKAVMGSNPSYFSSCGANCPVEQVSWCDAVLFANEVSRREGLTPAYGVPSGFVVGMDRETCNAKSASVRWDGSAGGYRLPTESEWEYAARGGQGFVYSGSGQLDAVAWHGGNSGGKTRAVGGKQSNGYGLFDMSGNVWEWTWDWKGSYPSGSVVNPRGPDEGSSRVFRGGSWLNVAWYARVADRDSLDPGFRNYDLGFRLSRSGP